MKLYINIKIKSQLAPDGKLAYPVANGRHWMKVSLPSRKAGRPVSITFHWGKAPQWSIQDPAELCHLLAQKLGLEAEAISSALFGGTADVSPRSKGEEVNSSSRSDDGLSHRQAGSPHQQDKSGAVSEKSEADGEKCKYTSTPTPPLQSSNKLDCRRSPCTSSQLKEDGKDLSDSGYRSSQENNNKKGPSLKEERVKCKDGEDMHKTDADDDSSSSTVKTGDGNEYNHVQSFTSQSSYQDEEEILKSIKEISLIDFEIKEIHSHSGGSSKNHLRGSGVPVAVDITPATGKFNPVKWYAKQQFGMPLHRIKDYDMSKFEAPIIVYLDTSYSMISYIPIVEGLVSSLQAQGQDVFLFLGPNGRVYEQVTPVYKEIDRRDNISLSYHLQKEKLLGMVEKIFIFADDDPHWMVSSLAKISGCDIIWYHIGHFFYEEKIDGVDYHIITSPQQLRYFSF